MEALGRVEEDAALASFPNGGKHLSLAIKHPVFRPVITVCDDVAFSQQSKDLFERRVRSVNVDHQGHLTSFGGCNPSLEAFNVFVPLDGFLKPYLDAHDGWPITLRGLGGQRWVHPIQVLHCVINAHYQAESSDIDQCINAGGRSANHVLSQPRNQRIDRRAGVYNSGDSFGEASMIRTDSALANRLKNMGMDINQTRSDNFALGRNHLVSPARRNILRDLKNFPISNRYVEYGMQLLSRIDHRPSLDDDVAIRGRTAVGDLQLTLFARQAEARCSAVKGWKASSCTHKNLGKLPSCNH